MFLFYLIAFIHGTTSLPIQFIDSVLAERLSADTKDVAKPTLLSSITSDPKKFVSEMQNLDPTALAHVLTLLEELLESSRSTENDLVQDLTNKNAAFETASVDVTNAEDVLDDANDDVTAAEEVLTAKQQAASTATTDLNNKKAIRTAKRTEQEASQSRHDDQLPGLNSEQHVLTEVINMLKGLPDYGNEFDVRLTSYPRGRLQLFTQGDWHDVCGHYFWDNQNGYIAACKKLGYADGGVGYSMWDHGQTLGYNPVYVGQCKPGEAVGECTGDMNTICSRNALGCGAGDCAQGSKAVIEVECSGQRQE